MLGTLLGCKPFKKNKAISGEIVGANSKVGHLLRYGIPNSEIKSIEQIETVIVGSGVSGLSAGRHLQKQQRDFLVLELAEVLGGNSMAGRNSFTDFPWGAHYVPIPNNDLVEYLEFLKESGILLGYDSIGLPIYQQESLCYDPQERLFIHGQWQDGLIPNHGLNQIEKDEIQRFLSLMAKYKTQVGADGKYAFSIPLDNSSKDPIYAQLDQISFKNWLIQNDFKSKTLHWYLNYCTKDDFGTQFDLCSAWAGIHYFACRKGKLSNGESGDLLTWPEGNFKLVKALSESYPEKIKTNALVVRVQTILDKVEVDYWNTQTNSLHRLVCKHCIMATPQYVNKRLLPQLEFRNKLIDHLEYVPWLVANIEINGLDNFIKQDLAWDNVIYNSESLGYVVANHQKLGMQKQSVFTFYNPLTQTNVKKARKEARIKKHAEWAEIIVSELEKAHPTIRDYITKVDIMIWGHAMAQPKIGHIYGDWRKELQKSVGHIHFAHTDLAGISIFEEGFYQGLKAANCILTS